MLKSSSIPFNKKNKTKQKKSRNKNVRLLSIQIKMIAATVFQNFTPVQKDESKKSRYTITTSQFSLFFLFEIQVFPTPVLRFLIWKASPGLGHVSCAEPIAPHAPLPTPAPKKPFGSPFTAPSTGSSPPATSLICRETHLTNMGVLTSYKVYLRAQDTRPHNQPDQPAEQTSLFHLFSE